MAINLLLRLIFCGIGAVVASSGSSVTNGLLLKCEAEQLSSASLSSSESVSLSSSASLSSSVNLSSSASLSSSVTSSFDGANVADSYKQHH